MSTSDLPQGAKANTISLMIGHPDPSTLFTPPFQAAVSRAMSESQAVRALQYAPEQGHPALIDYLVKKFSAEQHIALAAEQLMVVSGSTHAVDMIARLYTQPGDVVIVEAPTYADAIHIFRDHGVEFRSVPMDADGMIVAELERLLNRLSAEGIAPRLLYTIPTFHNPTGITLTEQRRVEIIRLARQHHLMIVEDDVYRDLAFDAPTPTSLFALADGIDVMHIGSFSKTLAPGLRLGWLIASAKAVEGFVNCGTTQMGGGASPLSGQIVAEYCRAGDWEVHVAQLRRLYQTRRDRMLAALADAMPPGVTWTHPLGGFFVWVTLPPSVQAQDVKRLAAERGVMVAAGEGYFVNPADGAHNLRLTFSFAPPDDIETGGRILAEVVRRLANP